VAGFQVAGTANNLDSSDCCLRVLRFNAAFFDGSLEHAVDEFDCIFCRSGFCIGQAHAQAAGCSDLRYSPAHRAESDESNNCQAAPVQVSATVSQLPSLSPSALIALALSLLAVVLVGPRRGATRRHSR